MIIMYGCQVISLLILLVVLLNILDNNPRWKMSFHHIVRPTRPAVQSFCKSLVLLHFDRLEFVIENDHREGYRRHMSKRLLLVEKIQFSEINGTSTSTVP